MLLFKLVFLIAKSINISIENEVPGGQVRILRMNHSSYRTYSEDHGCGQRQLLNIPPLPIYSCHSSHKELCFSLWLLTWGSFVTILIYRTWRKQHSSNFGAQALKRPNSFHLSFLGALNYHERNPGYLAGERSQMKKPSDIKHYTERGKKNRHCVLKYLVLNPDTVTIWLSLHGRPQVKTLRKGPCQASANPWNHET